MGADNCTEDLGQEGNRLLGKMLQGPVQDTVQARQEVQRLEEELGKDSVFVTNSVQLVQSINN